MITEREIFLTDPEEKARVKIDKQLNNAGWDIVDRKDYLPQETLIIPWDFSMMGNLSAQALSAAVS